MCYVLLCYVLLRMYELTCFVAAYYYLYDKLRTRNGKCPHHIGLPSLPSQYVCNALRAICRHRTGIPAQYLPIQFIDWLWSVREVQLAQT